MTFALSSIGFRKQIPLTILETSNAAETARLRLSCSSGHSLKDRVTQAGKTPSGHVSHRMLQHYAHIRTEAKRIALETQESERAATAKTAA